MKISTKKHKRTIDLKRREAKKENEIKNINKIAENKKKTNEKKNITGAPMKQKKQQHKITATTDAK